MKKIIGICGSVSQNSSNLTILKFIATVLENEFDFEIINDLADFPLFRTELTDKNVPQKIIDFYQAVAN